ncbi:conjugal transfer protein TraF [Oceanospirillum sp.]|uniref:conjugal transfer protein TraF n=1 Tax=Oceanospirillum sp. TaxID=2021254 RepID=UPI003A90409D
MKKNILTAAVTLALSGPAFSAVVVGNYGASTTLGQVASPTTVNSVLYNPAAGYLVLDTEEESVRLGYLSQIGGSLEFGEADNFQDEVDRFMDALDDFDDDLMAGRYTSIAEADAAADVILDDFSSVLKNFGDSGRIKTAFSAAVPGLPAVFQVGDLPGVISVDASVSAISAVSFLDAPLQKVGTGDLSDYDLKTDSAVFVRGGALFQLGLGYSQPVSDLNAIGDLSGQLILGAKANLYSASLSQEVAAVDRDDDEDVGDLISDGLDDNSRDSSALGVDLGAVWLAENYQLGFAVKNINSPELKYGSLQDSADAQAFSSEISLDGGVTLETQGTVDGAVFLKERSLMLAASADLNKVDDLVGDEVQMLHVSGVYFPSSAVVPTVRLGYEKNLSGEELSAVNFGMGLFRGVANFDLTYGLDTAEVDGDSIPRRLGLQLSFEESF